MFERFPPPRPAALATLALCALAGALGALPGAAGALDPVSELAWLALFAPAAGALCGARGIALLPFGLAVPGTWFLLLAGSVARSQRDFATPLWAALVVAGLFACGHACGRAAPSGWRTAGLLFLLGLLSSGAALGFGLLAPGAELARVHPELAARLLDLSPLTLVFDCVGWDWTHAQPDVYAHAGSEWFQRRPYPGNLAGPAVLVVGCALSWLGGLRQRVGPSER